MHGAHFDIITADQTMKRCFHVKLAVLQWIQYTSLRLTGLGYFGTPQSVGFSFNKCTGLRHGFRFWI